MAMNFNFNIDGNLEKIFKEIREIIAVIVRAPPEKFAMGIIFLAILVFWIWR